MLAQSKLHAKAQEKPADVNRAALATMLMNLFDHWKLSSEEMLSALGLSTDNRSALSKYRKGEPISSSRDQMDRAGNLFAIHKSLGLLFPENPEYRYAWMKTRNKAFDGRTPIETIVEMGFPGLLFVRSYLDVARGG